MYNNTLRENTRILTYLIMGINVRNNYVYRRLTESKTGEFRALQLQASESVHMQNK